jgi:hypothetical protein
LNGNRGKHADMLDSDGMVQVEGEETRFKSSGLPTKISLPRTNN